jgi:hypothetical protein
MTQPPDLDNLRITPREVDDLTGLDVGDLTMGWAYRLSLFRSPQRLGSWLITQGLTLGVALVLWVPVTLLIGRSLGDSAQTASVVKFLPMGGGIAIATTLTWNLVLLYRGKQRATLAHLLDEIDHFNEILTALDILRELQSVSSRSLSLQNPDQVLEALHLTRENLVNGLITERILRQHQRFIARRYDLFNRIEQISPVYRPCS